MNIHYLQHVEYESPASILDWAKMKNHKITSTKFYLNEPLPKISEFDFLIIMGGPMNIYDTKNYPYLTTEKHFIKNCIKNGKAVLGICLGAQLIADVLGAKVTANKEKEIGWFPIKALSNTENSELFKIINTDSPVFHWHGDTFEIPDNGIRLAESSACKNQAFVYNNSVFALQYHLEMTYESLKKLINNCRNEIVDAPFVQTEEEMLKEKTFFDFINKKMFLLLDYIEKSIVKI